MGKKENEEKNFLVCATPSTFTPSLFVLQVLKMLVSNASVHHVGDSVVCGSEVLLTSSSSCGELVTCSSLKRSVLSPFQRELQELRAEKVQRDGNR